MNPSMLSTPARRIASGLLVAAALSFALFTTGCDPSQAERGAASTVAPAAARASAPDGPPTLAELQAALDLTAEETAALAPALMTWQKAVDARRAGRPGLGRGGEGRRQSPACDNPGRGRGQRGSAGRGPRADGVPGGPGTPRGLDGPGFARGLDPDWTPPGAAFLVDAARVLDLPATAALASWLGDRADARMAALRTDRGGRARGSFGTPHRGLGVIGLRGALAAADLDRDEMREVRPLLQEFGDEVVAALSGYEGSSLSSDAVRDRVVAAREALLAGVGEVVGQDRIPAFEAGLAEGRTSMASRRLDRLEGSLARRQSFLTTVLELEPAQVGQLATILAGVRADEEALLTGIAGGSVDLGAAIETGLGLREETRTAIRAILTEAQVQVFDALPRRGAGMMLGLR